MSDLIWLSEAQMRRIEPYFPLSHGVPRVDDRRIISGIIFVIRNGLRWRDAPAEYGPAKTIYNRFIRWSRMGVFNKIFAALAAKGGKPDQLMIDATHLKAHRTAASLLKKGLFPDVSDAPRGEAAQPMPGAWARTEPELQTPCRLRWQGATAGHAAQ
jgi:transposase